MRLSKQRWFQSLLIGGLSMWLGAAAPAQASIVTKLSLSDMTVRAEQIMVGTVEEVRSRYADDARTTIITEVRIRCARSLYGAKAGEVITVRALGGVVGEIGQRVFGEASYRAGEEVLILAEERSGAYYAVGMAQGALHIDRQSGEPRVHVDLSGAELVPPGSSAATVSSASVTPTADGVALEAVVGQLQRLIAQNKAARVTTPSSTKPAAAASKTGGK